MPEPRYQCPNCRHICTESQAMLTQGVCKPCRVGGKGEFCLDDLPPEENQKQGSKKLTDCSTDCSQLGQDIIAMCRQLLAPNQNVLSLIGLSRFLEVIACFVQVHGTKGNSPFRGLDVVFHGTDPEHLPIIRESGLIRPDGVYHQAKNGQALGKGVYATAQWTTASSYGPLVLVCLAMPGMRARGNLKDSFNVNKGEVFSWSPDTRIVYGYDGQVLPLVAVSSRAEAEEVKDVMMQAKRKVESSFGIDDKAEQQEITKPRHQTRTPQQPVAEEAGLFSPDIWRVPSSSSPDMWGSPSTAWTPYTWRSADAWRSPYPRGSPDAWRSASKPASRW